MSFEAAAWAIQQSPKEKTEKLVLIALADCYNRHTTRCDPSILHLSNVALCSERSAIRAVKSLEEQGYIKAKHTRGKRTNYTLILDRVSDYEKGCHSVSSDTMSPEVVTPCHPTPDTMSPKPGINQEYKPVINTIVSNGDSHTQVDIEDQAPAKALAKPKAKRQTKPEALKEFWAQYPEHRRGGTDQQAWKVFKAEGLTAQDAELMLNDVIRRKSTDHQWLQGYVQGITKYIRERTWLTPISTRSAPGQMTAQQLRDKNFTDNMNGVDF